LCSHMAQITADLRYLAERTRRFVHPVSFRWLNRVYSKTNTNTNSNMLNLIITLPIVFCQLFALAKSSSGTNSHSG